MSIFGDAAKLAILGLLSLLGDNSTTVAPPHTSLVTDVTTLKVTTDLSSLKTATETFDVTKSTGNVKDLHTLFSQSVTSIETTTGTNTSYSTDSTGEEGNSTTESATSSTGGNFTTDSVTSSTGGDFTTESVTSSTGGNFTTESVTSTGTTEAGSTVAPTEKPKLSRGAVAGIVIGCLLLIAVVAAAIVYLVKKRQNGEADRQRLTV